MSEKVKKSIEMKPKLHEIKKTSSIDINCGIYLSLIHVFFYNKIFYKKMSLKNLTKMLRKSPASNA